MQLRMFMQYIPRTETKNLDSWLADLCFVAIDFDKITYYGQTKIRNQEPSSIVCLWMQTKIRNQEPSSFVCLWMQIQKTDFEICNILDVTSYQKLLPRNVRTNPVKTHKPSPIFQPKCRAAVKSMGMPKTAISKSEKLFGADFNSYSVLHVYFL